MLNNSLIITELGKAPKRKYYVYRLIAPRNYQTFYVGKGCGDRVFQHVKMAKSLISKDEDDSSLKFQRIAEIIGAGKEVIMVIHRRGLNEKEAFEVESALIDAYPGLTNIQKGHDSERGCIVVDDLNTLVTASDYDEPEEKYIIIKTTPNAVFSSGSLYEATRRSWKADIKRAQRYKYVLAVVNGIVREVYEADSWYKSTIGDRIEFEGKPTDNTEFQKLKNMRIPQKYRLKGAANPFIYKK